MAKEYIPPKPPVARPPKDEENRQYRGVYSGTEDLSPYRVT